MIKVGIFMADGCEEIEGLTVGHYPSRWQRPVRGLLSGKAASGERDEESGSVLRGNFHLLDAGHLHSRSERVAAYHAGPDVSPAVQMLVKPEQI